jgi:hypothetical protein
LHAGFDETTDESFHATSKARKPIGYKKGIACYMREGTVANLLQSPPLWHNEAELLGESPVLPFLPNGEKFPARVLSFFGLTFDD